jgi:hypothetical protein
MSTIYINTPFPRHEHDTIQEMARREGRSKGQQLRFLALEALKAQGLLIPARPASATRRATKKRGAQTNLNHA